MADRKISSFTTVQTPTGNMFVPAVDLTRATGDQNIKLPALSLAGSGGGGTPGSGVTPTTNHIFNISTPVAATTDTEIYTPALTTTDIEILSLTISSPALGAPVYNFELWAGDPSSANSTNLYDNQDATGVLVGADGEWTASLTRTLYVPAAVGSNAIYLRVINQDVNPAVVNAQIVVIEWPGHGVAMPVYVTPPPYVGALLNDVFVGPTRTLTNPDGTVIPITEPRYGLCALADGGTMHVDPGMYYLPFGVSGNPANNAHINAQDNFPDYGYNPNRNQSVGNFVAGITIVGSGTYTSTPTIFNGRGGYGLQATHPFRLIQGKGYLYINSPITISGVRFYYCGGNDQNSDGEAGIYAELFPTAGQVHIHHCGFDMNENGIFTPHWQSSSSEASPAQGTGPGNNITMLIEDCDFGYLLPNGYGGDGYSHDHYLENPFVTVNNCNFYGDLSPWPSGTQMRVANTVVSGEAGSIVNPPTSGNCLKLRVWQATVNNCWVRNQSGKLVDMPDGGSFTYTDCTFSTLSGSASLALGYGTEMVYSNEQMVSPKFVGCKWYLSRPSAVWWMNVAGCAFDLTDAGNEIFWTNSSASLVVNRTNAGFGSDGTAISLNGTITFATDALGNYTAPAGTTFVPNPAAPPPASLLSGQTASQPPLNP